MKYYKNKPNKIKLNSDFFPFSKRFLITFKCDLFFLPLLISFIIVKCFNDFAN